MKLLLDTHIWLWSALETNKLSEPTRAAILDPTNTIHVSAASIWEVAIKTEKDASLAELDAWTSRVLTAATLDEVLR